MGFYWLGSKEKAHENQFTKDLHIGDRKTYEAYESCSMCGGATELKRPKKEICSIFLFLVEQSDNAPTRRRARVANSILAEQVWASSWPQH